MQNQDTLISDIEFIGRQLGEMGRRDNFDIDSALLTIEQSQSGKLAAAINQLRSLLTSGKAIPGSAYATLGEYLPILSPSKNQLGATIHQFSRAQIKLQEDVAVYLLGLRSTFSYLSALFAIMVAVFILNTQRVLPSFIEIYNDVDSALPEFTSFVIGSGQFLVWLIFIFIASLISFTVYGALKINKHIREMRVIPNNPIWALIARDLLASVNSCILFIYLSLSLRAGYDLDTAKRHCLLLLQRSTKANTLEDYLSPQYLSKLDICAALNTTNSELDYQVQNASEVLISNLTKFRTNINISLQIIIVTIIGAMVIAFYLPLFQLGSVV